MRQCVKMLLWVGVLTGAMALTGCKSTDKKTTPSPPLPTQKSTMETLSIYTIDSDTMTLVPVTVKKSTDKLTPEYITSLVEESLDDETVRVYSVEQEDERVYLSFYRDGKPFVKCSKKMENLILDCFANSLLDNLDECKKIVFRCEGKAYKSENYSFKINEVYASE